MILGEFATNAAIAELEERLGLNLPLYEQYWRWFSGLMRGDFGRSLTMDRPAGPVILEALGRSAILASISIVLVAIIGIALGIHSATHVGSWSDRGLTLMQYFFIAVPEFFWCILVIIFSAVWLGWLPATGYTPLADGGFIFGGTAQSQLIPFHAFFIDT
jgi:peptide/nickel transport system permease protein